MLSELDYLQNSSVELAQLLHSGISIIVTSNYKGICLSQPVRVLRVEPGRVILQAPESPLSVTLKEKVHLYSHAFSQMLSARLVALNRVFGTLELADIAFTGGCWNERKYDRVQSKTPIYVYGEQKKTQIRANVDNLSVEGVSLMVYQHRDKAIQVDRDAAIRLTLQLPADSQPWVVKGKVIHVHQAGKIMFIGLQLAATAVQQARINRYVMGRKAEILAELRQASHTFSEQPGVPGLNY